MHPLYYRGGYFDIAGKKLLGTYVAWLLSQDSALLLHDWMKFVGVPEPTTPEDLHCTIVYAPDCHVDEDMHGDYRLDMPYASLNNGDRRVSVFGENKDSAAIVLEIGGTQLHRRHEFYRDHHGLEPNFPEYKPHVTLSYNGKDFPQDVLRRIIANPYQAPITFDRERIEPLKDD